MFRVGRELPVLAALVALVALGGLGPSSASGADISVGYERSGRGWMSVGQTTEGQTWTWKACHPRSSRCDLLGSGYWRRQTHRTRHGSLFRAISNDGEVANSPRWRGRLRSIRSPAVRGEIRANQLVTPVHGKWLGGWDGSKHFTQLAACPTRGDRECTTLTELHYVEGCRNGGAVLDPVFTGQYLRVADWRVGPRPKLFLRIVPSPYGYEIWKQSPIVSVDFPGQIQPPAGPRAAACGPPPLESLPSQ
jgi:hypothetical protein